MLLWYTGLGDRHTQGSCNKHFPNTQVPPHRSSLLEYYGVYDLSQALPMVHYFLIGIFLSPFTSYIRISTKTFLIIYPSLNSQFA